ncbi:hypothetical protein BC937DRAFT_92024, partial [Endogone sp. FLAS-F59071]
GNDEATIYDAGSVPRRAGRDVEPCRFDWRSLLRQIHVFLHHTKQCRANGDSASRVLIKHRMTNIPLCLHLSRWIGIGFGPKMTGEELNVMWINPNNTSIVLSRRKAIAETLPAALPNQTAITLIKPAGSSAGNPFVSNNQLSFSYSRPQVLPESTLNTASTQFVWAYGSVKPATDSPTGVFNQHIATGTFTLNLAKPITSPTTTGTTTGTGAAASSIATVNGTSNNSTDLPDFSPPPTGLTDMDYMTIAHGIIMFIAWGILVPVA